MADLRDLSSLSKQLNEGTDQLNHSLQSIQDSLNEMGIGLEVWLLGDEIAAKHWAAERDDREDPTGRRGRQVTLLGYGRLGDGWALLVREGTEVEQKDQYGNWEYFDLEDLSDPKPLLRASRGTRIAAVPFLQKLIDELEQEAQRAIDNIERARKLADSLKNK
jgi:hypothetical protein